MSRYFQDGAESSAGWRWARVFSQTRRHKSSSLQWSGTDISLPTEGVIGSKSHTQNVYVWLSLFAVHLKLSWHCSLAISQYKIKIKKKKKIFSKWVEDEDIWSYLPGDSLTLRISSLMNLRSQPNFTPVQAETSTINLIRKVVSHSF